MYWKLSYQLCMEFFPCKKTPCSALPALLQPWPLSALGWCFPGELQSFVWDERRFLTLRTGAQSVASMAEFPWILSCPAVLSQTSASCCSPRRVDGLEGWGWSLARAAAQPGEQQLFQEPSRAWQPCLCPGHVPPVPLLVLLLFLCPLSGHTWAPGSHHSKSLTWCHLPVGSPLLKPQGAAGKGRDGVALHLPHPVLCPLLLDQGVESCRLWGQAEPATSTCPGLPGSDSPALEHEEDKRV